MRSLTRWLVLGAACGCHGSPDKGDSPSPAGDGGDGGSTVVGDTAPEPEDTGIDDTGGSTELPCESDCDHDGYSTEEGDCDDADDTVSPGATEIPYDGLDQDCDGADLTDVDGDGWDAWEVGGEDCNDEVASANPDGVEVDDNWVDDDCDGYADLEGMSEWEPDVIWAGTEEEEGSQLAKYGLSVFSDLDGDGYAEIACTASYTLFLLSSGGGASTSAETDAFGMIRGEKRDDPPWGTTDPRGMLPVSDADGDGNLDLVVGLRGRSNYGATQGFSVFTWSTLAAGGQISGAEAFATVYTDYNGADEAKLASLDIDADGVDDLFVAERWYNGSYGRVSRIDQSDLVSGLWVDVEDIGQNLWAPELTHGYFGYDVFSLGDLDGDGYPTLAVVDGIATYLLDGDTFSTMDNLELHDLDYTVIYQEDSDISDSGSGSYPLNMISPDDLDGDGHPDLLLYDGTGGLKVDGSYLKGGHVDVFLDLWEGGSSSAAAANAHLADTGVSNSAALVEMVGPAHIRHQGSDIVLAGKEGIFFVGLEEIPLTGVLDLYQWPHRIANEGAWPCYQANVYRGLAVADQDGDGDDDVVCSNHYLGEDLNAGTYDGDYEPGVVAVFFNRN